jgi:hypothetical protein
VSQESAHLKMWCHCDLTKHDVLRLHKAGSVNGVVLLAGKCQNGYADNSGQTCGRLVGQHPTQIIQENPKASCPCSLSRTEIWVLHDSGPVCGVLLLAGKCQNEDDTRRKCDHSLADHPDATNPGIFPA